MSMKRTCPISNFTSASDDIRFLYHDLRNLTRSRRLVILEQSAHLLRDAEPRETGSLQFLIERNRFLRNDFSPTLRELSCLGPNIVYRSFNAIGGHGVDALNFLEQILGRIQSMQRRSRARSCVWRSQLF